MPLPVQLNEIWDFLHSEVVWLHGRWNLFKQLYSMNPERIEILNKTASSFFLVIHNVLLNDIQLTLSKLADPASTFKRPNLTLETLLQEIDKLSEPLLSSDLASKLDIYRNACMQIKDRRNKNIAHYDFATQSKKKLKPFIGPSQQEIEEALTALRDFMVRVYSHFEGSYMSYEPFALSNGSNKLIKCLKKGLRYNELIEEGSINHNDLSKAYYYKV